MNAIQKVGSNFRRNGAEEKEEAFGRSIRGLLSKSLLTGQQATTVVLCVSEFINFSVCDAHLLSQYPTCSLVLQRAGKDTQSLTPGPSQGTGGR